MNINYMGKTALSHLTDRLREMFSDKEHDHHMSDIVDLPDDIGQEDVFVQPDEPADAPDGSLWVDTDEDVVLFPCFDLVEMGLPTIPVGGQVRCDTDTNAILQALRDGSCKFTISVDIDSEIILAEISGTHVYVDSLGAYQVVSTSFYNDWLRGRIEIGDGYIRATVEYDKASPDDLIGLPAYSESDIGKFLSVTDEGLSWVNADTILPYAEEATF